MTGLTAMQQLSRLLVCLGVYLIIAAISLRAEIYDQVPVPDFQKQSLLNGMEILFLDSNERRVPFVLMLKNGAAFDPVNKWGVTYLTSQMMVEGTESRTGAHLREDLQKLDAELEVKVDWDAIYFSGSAPMEQVAEVLSILAEVVIRPRFDEETFTKVRDRLVGEVETENQRPEAISEQLFRARLFEGNPYEHSAKGTLANLRNLYLADVKIQYRKLFMPNQAQLAVYHSGGREKLYTALSRRWGSWVRGDALPFSFRRAQAPPELRILLADRPGEESLFRWGSLAVEKGAREYYALKVFEQYLALTLPSWASQVASEQSIKALARLEARKMPGYIQLSIQASPEQLPAYIQKFRDFLKSVHHGEIDPPRFEEAKQLAYLDFRRSFDSPAECLYQLLQTDLYSLGINFIANYGYRLHRVTPEAVQSALRRQLPLENSLLVVVGPAEILQNKLKELGKVELVTP